MTKLYEGVFRYLSYQEPAELKSLSETQMQRSRQILQWSACARSGGGSSKLNHWFIKNELREVVLREHPEAVNSHCVGFNDRLTTSPVSLTRLARIRNFHFWVTLPGIKDPAQSQILCVSLEVCIVDKRLGNRVQRPSRVLCIYIYCTHTRPLWTGWVLIFLWTRSHATHLNTKPCSRSSIKVGHNVKLLPLGSYWVRESD